MDIIVSHYWRVMKAVLAKVRQWICTLNSIFVLLIIFFVILLNKLFLFRLIIFFAILMIFLAVQDSSIGDLVTQSVSE